MTTHTSAPSPAPHSPVRHTLTVTWPALIIAALITTVASLPACSSYKTPQTPTPLPPDGGTANAYILPGASNLGANAFGDEPVVIHKGERLQWRNTDSVVHDVVADSPSFPEFAMTGPLSPGGEQAFVMNTAGTTRIHCSIHPQMVGTLIVQ